MASFKSGNLTVFPACRYGFSAREVKAMSSVSTESKAGTRRLIISPKPLRFVGLNVSAAVLGYPLPISIADLWTGFVPKYQSQNYGPAIFTIRWDRGLASKVGMINPKRLVSRFAAYVIEGEIERVRRKLDSGKDASIRFGNLKPGLGYKGERGDFCMVAGAVKKRELTLYYRSLEMIGGFAYDLALLAVLEGSLKCDWRTVTFVTQKAFVFALRGNSNEKLYPKLQGIFKTKT